MSTFNHPWSVCGGWAVDAWLGRQTRDHQDFDITVFHDDQRALFEHLAGWRLVAHGPNVEGNPTDLWDGRQLDLPAHIHARPGGDANLKALLDGISSPGSRDPDGLDLEFILNERRDGEWLLSDGPGVSLPLDQAVRRSPAGLPTAVPRVLMYFKATAYWGTPGYPRRHDLDDFRALIPLLSPEDMDWLQRSLAAFVHPWLTHLA